MQAAQSATGLRRNKSWPSLGNHVNSGKIYSTIDEYVQAKQGKRVIERILIANNGIAAVKGIRSMQKWAYETFGDEKMIKFIAMATPDDIKVNAEYIHLANEVVDVPGGSNNNNYANVSLIIDIAQRLKADAVWAGWGHASENPKLPDGLALHNQTSKHQIVWIGPTGSAMRALGDKIGSTLIAQTAGVPCIGWSGSGLEVDTKQKGEIPEEIYEKACVKTPDQAVEVGKRVGYPIMIKASEGGGGKGIRMCHEEKAVRAAFAQVVGEVPGSPIFIMQLSPTCRHLEVQLLGDEWGNAIAVLGRDCSIQRRHQKIIEEGPVVAAKPKIWREMEQSAVRLAKAVGYVGAGTVEYLYTQDNKYFFLELNPRLQVEHPVTELISGVNLPAAQLQIAMGIPMNNMPHIRHFYGKKAEDVGKIDFDKSIPVQQPLHVIACRITAENPEMEFQPTSGTIFHLNFRSTPNVWGYFSVSSNGGVHQFADSQFGHLFATAKTRENARRNMVQALKELSIQGEIRTTVEYLSYILETRDFVENQVSTNWLEGVMKDKTIADKGKIDPQIVVTLGAVYQGYNSSEEASKEFMNQLASGRMPSIDMNQKIIASDINLIYQLVKYGLHVTRSGPMKYDVQLKGSKWTASIEVHDLADKGLLAMLDGKRYIVYGRQQPDGLRLTIDSKTYMFSREYDPTRLIAEMQGKLVRYTVEDGGHVRKNSAYAEMEVMKMYIALVAPEDGVLTHCKPEGAVLDGGDLIASLELDDPSSITAATPFEGKFSPIGPPQPLGSKPNTLLAHATTQLKRLLSGYKLGAGRRLEAVNTLMGSLRNPLLPAFECGDIMSTISAKMPSKLHESLQSITGRYKQALSTHRFHWEKPDPFPAPEMLEVIQTHLLVMDQKGAGALSALMEPLTNFLKLYSDGNHTHAVHIITDLLTQYYEVESHFTMPAELVVKKLRREHKDNVQFIADVTRAHYLLAPRNALISDLAGILCDSLRPLLDKFEPILKKISTLEGPGQTQVSILSRRVLLAMNEPTFEQRKLEVEAVLKTTQYSKTTADRRKVLAPLAARPGKIENLLLELMSHRSAHVRRAALEAFVLRNNQGYQSGDIHTSTQYGFVQATFNSTVDGKSGGGELLDDLARSSGRKLQVPLKVTGTMAFFSDPEQLRNGFKVLFPSDAKTPELSENDVRTIYLILRSDIKDDNKASDSSRSFLEENAAQLAELGVARVTLVVAFRESRIRYFTFRQASGFKEDTLIRHLRPQLANQIDLGRLKHFNVKLLQSHGSTKVLEAIPQSYKPSRDGYDGRRLFLRRVVQNFTASDLVSPNSTGIGAHGDLSPNAESQLYGLITSLDLAVGDSPSRYRNNNVGVLVPTPLSATRQAILDHVTVLVDRYSAKLFRQLSVHAVEFSCSLIDPKKNDSPPEKVFVVATNPTGFLTHFHQYVHSSGTYREVGGSSNGPLNGKSVDTPYPVSLDKDRQRQAARRVGSVYVYDFITLFDVALRGIWEQAGGTPPKAVVDARELTLENKNGELTIVETKRAAGLNDIAMVAWQITLFTPQYPKGREMILIANDIAVRAGSFGVDEDDLFNLASRRARQLGIPRLYFSVNSGARIGLAAELKYKFRVAWNQDDVTKGPAYLYLNEEEHATFAKSVKSHRLTAKNGEVRYKITDIIGQDHGLGVENLSGSGLIAGETSKAYDEIFTLTYCCGRSVGIGAYLARLGQRVIQKASEAPILLTGHFALNKLLGRMVYTSNDQLGGIDIMHTNGTTHQVVADDLAGVAGCLHWLAFCPARRGEGVPVPPPSASPDPIDRKVEFCPPSAPYDPRHMIAGVPSPDAKTPWKSGFFDKGSFIELMSGWAKTVVCGRARLGGLPVGVIAVTTNTVEQTIPADPAAPASKEVVQMKAGQVWYPDSAFKTAQAIRDMDGEDLPLIIFANWRGFSGGMRDMFDEVLKFGSQIVDALVAYTQPISVYLPPHATLRGGAWVVVDSKINPYFIQMCADPTARGGILEVEGTCGIKFRRRDELKTAYRLDASLQAMRSNLEDKEKEVEEGGEGGEGGDVKQELLQQIRDREQKVLPSFHQAAALFVGLHDTPGRMKAKGIIKDIVPWQSSRRYFYWNMRRRSAVTRLVKSVREATPSLSWFEAEKRVKEVIAEANGGAGSGFDSVWADDEKVVALIDKSATLVQALIPSLRIEHVMGGLKKMNLAKEQAKALKDWVNSNL